MLLAIDVGNTSIHCGLFRGDRLYRQWNLRRDTKVKQHKEVTAAVICSVVPKLTLIVKRALSVPTLEVNSGLDLGLKIRYKNPNLVGADRLANAVAVKYLYSAPALVIDFGTATTIDVISHRGDYLGGVILPGIEMVRKGLAENTAMLPLVQLRRPKRILGQNTKEAIQSGLYYGFCGMIKQLILDLKKELRFSKKTVIIATGGYADFLDMDMEVDPNLTLKGLKLIYERNKVKIYC